MSLPEGLSVYGPIFLWGSLPGEGLCQRTAGQKPPSPEQRLPGQKPWTETPQNKDLSGLLWTFYLWCRGPTYECLSAEKVIMFNKYIMGHQLNFHK